MSTATKPAFTTGAKANNAFQAFYQSKFEQLEKSIYFTLSKESKAVREVYKYLRYVDIEKLGFAYPSIKRIARVKNLSERTVYRAINRLEEIRLIQRFRFEGHNIYVFTLPSHLEELRKSIEKTKEKGKEIVENLGSKSLKGEQKRIMSLPFVSPKCHPNIYNNTKRIEELAPTELLENLEVIEPISPKVKEIQEILKARMQGN